MQAGSQVLVTGDDPLLVRGLVLLLDRVPAMDAVYVESLARARRLLPAGTAWTLVWVGDDLAEPVLDELRRIRSAAPRSGLCLVARRADGAALERLVAANAERLAFVLRESGLDFQDVVDVVRLNLRGRSTLDAALLRRMTSQRRVADELGLTQSEREVMELLASGLRNREIGRRLWKSEKAVEKRVGRLFHKLGLRPETTRHLDRRVTATRIYLAGADVCDHGLVERRFEVPPLLVR